MTRVRVFGSALLIAATVALMNAPGAVAASRKELDRDGIKALQTLYAKNPAARRLGDKARAVLVFPNIVKAGFLFGGQIGEGAEGRQAGFLLQLRRGLLRLAGGRPGLRLRAVLHERRCAQVSR